MQLTYDSLTSAQKAAIALIAFGSDVSSAVLKDLSDSELEKITVEIANMRDVSAELEEKVIQECYDIYMARTYINQGGVDYARSVLEKAVGKTRTIDLMKKLENSMTTTGFDLLKGIDPKQLAQYFQNEHPQTISLILTQLNSGQASTVLTELPAELQAEVAYRVATMEKVSPEILKQIETTLDSHFGSSATRDLSVSGGTKTIAEILNLVDTSTEKNILQALEAEDSELAMEIKNMMFVFEDIVLLDDRAIQRVLREVETKDLSIALKAANDEVKQKIFSNVSERVSVMIQEEMEYMGPMRLSDVEAAQQGIVEAIRRLEEQGQIVISGRGGKEDIVV